MTTHLRPSPAPPVRDPRITAMFLFEGFRDYLESAGSRSPGDGPGHPTRAELIDIRVGGAIEQAHTVAPFAHVVDTALVAVLPTDLDLPGVVEYEVVNPIGWYLAERASGDHGLPTVEDVAHLTTQLVRDFLDDGNWAGIEDAPAATLGSPWDVSR